MLDGGLIVLLFSRSDSDHESSRRIKTEFLVQLDGANSQVINRFMEADFQLISRERRGCWWWAQPTGPRSWMRRQGGGDIQLKMGESEFISS